jgi:hypothetical protein
MVVEKVQVAAGQASNFGKSIIDTLRIEAASALVERVLVAEIAVLRLWPRRSIERRRSRR